MVHLSNTRDMSKIINFIYLKPLFSLSPMKFQIRRFHSKLIIRIFQNNFIIFIAVRDMYKPKLTTSKILADLSSDIVQHSSPLSLIPRSSILPSKTRHKIIRHKFWKDENYWSTFCLSSSIPVFNKTKNMLGISIIEILDFLHLIFLLQNIKQTNYTKLGFVMTTYF